jgi:hypothetical protein
MVNEGSLFSSVTMNSEKKYKREKVRRKEKRQLENSPRAG